MSFIGDLFGGGGADAAREAGQLQAAGAQAGIDETRRQFDVTQGILAPQVAAGDAARQEQLAFLGLSGPEAQQTALGQFGTSPDSPGQAFIRERQERALVRNASAIGGLGGGNVRTALQEQSAGFALQDLDRQDQLKSQRFNQLASITGGGQTAATNLGQFGAQSSGNVANLLAQQGQAQAGGVLGAQQARAAGAQNILGAIGTAASFFSDRRLKTNIKKIGRLGDVNLYEWNWKETGLKDQGFMADEIQTIYPDLVQTVNGFLSVIYDKVIGRQYGAI